MAEEEIKTTEPTTEALANEAPATDAPASDSTEKAAVPRRKKVKRTVASGKIHVLATFNNTIITVTDEQGNTLSTASAGGSGFRGSKKGTAYAAQVAAEKAINGAKQDYGLSKAEVLVKGVGLGRDAAVRTLINQRVAIESIKDVTGVPHGGVRPRKAKRN
jgi:small subunit ribosomal protein S11